MKRVYTDQTGRFPVRSSKGNNYIMVFYISFINENLGEPLRNRSNEEISKVYADKMNYLKSRNIKLTE